MRGRFITLEGLDGAGKSTQLGLAAEYLRARGLTVRITREPGGTALGEALRALLLDARQDYAPETEALLMFSARREHIDKVIAPALELGTWVLCDRFTDASFAYQGGGSGAHDEWDSKLVASLTEQLGAGYDVRYPPMPNEGEPRYAAWKAALIEQIDRLDDGAIVVGHSIGAAILINTLAEYAPKQPLGGIFIIAAPFIGDGGWPSDATRWSWRTTISCPRSRMSPTT